MKSGINFLVCALLLLTVVACKDDDDATPASLVGTWAMTDIHSTGTLEYDFLGTPLTSDYEFHGIEYNATTTFTENPNEFTSEGDYTFVITTDFFGTEFIDTINVPVFDGTGTWAINGNTMTQVFAGDTSEFDILEFTNSKLRLQQDLDVTYEEAGVIYHDEATVFSTFEKQ